MDLIKELGALALATRLKRLGEKLQKDASRIYGLFSVEFEGKWFALLYALNEHSPMGVTELADYLQLTHPAINQVSVEMEKAGLLKSTANPRDRRQRLLQLSDKGKNLCRSLEPLWSEIAAATEELVAESGVDLLSVLGKIEDSLDNEDIFTRVKKKNRSLICDKIGIIDYKPGLKKHFESLNREWLDEYFDIEPEDEKVLSDPNRHVIKPGGFILFARFNGKIIGTTAVKKHEGDIYELTKMGVTREYRGCYAGRKLTSKALEKLREMGVKKVVLQTSKKLKTAIKLYESFGFKRDTCDAPWAYGYSRETITMSLDL
ncbi:MAG: GNAT family N-acetyltransferase [candidate division Zixibacteria bacterium]|nr:GNAT family N-acetyltransferase [candidate division Zixibacteria bacterium]